MCQVATSRPCHASSHEDGAFGAWQEKIGVDATSLNLPVVECNGSEFH